MGIGNPSACSNTDGSYTCTCDEGHVPVLVGNVICRDIDECDETADLCGPNSVCTNTFGSVECGCIEGYEISFDLNGDFRQCVNENECNRVPNPCRVNNNAADCVDNVGGFVCFCQEGYTGDVGINEMNQCLNVNECLDTDNCQVSAGNEVTCNDNDGGFDCVCNNGFTAGE